MSATLYPDPCEGKFTLRSAGYDGLEYEVCDMPGQMSIGGQIASGFQNIDIGAVPDGIYTLVLGNGTVRFSIRK